MHADDIIQASRMCAERVVRDEPVREDRRDQQRVELREALDVDPVDRGTSEWVRAIEIASRS